MRLQATSQDVLHGLGGKYALMAKGTLAGNRYI